jgi:hypothetical protein
MGYYTDYELTWDATGADAKLLTHEHTTPKGAQYCPQCGAALGPASLGKAVREALGDVAECALDDGERIKWYEHEDDMKKLSGEMRGVLFILNGVGEEHGDEWVKYFKNGKMQVHKRPEWVKPACDTKGEWK